MTRHASPVRPRLIAQLFERDAASGAALSFCLPGGKPLFQAGEEADQLYFLRAGRLAVRLDDPHAPGRLGLIHPGEPVGEMALIAGESHSAEVFALRDSELVALPREAFLDAAGADPELLMELARLALSRTRAAAHDEVANAPRVFGIVGMSPAVQARALAEDIAASIRRLGHTVAVVGGNSHEASPEWLSNVESSNDYVLYAAEHDEAAWNNLLARQVDNFIRVARGQDHPGPQRSVSNGAAQARTPEDLILIHKSDVTAPKGCNAWTKAIAPARLFHMRESHPGDVARLARVITGQAVGLVLSGGAARAYAHVGAIQALREADVPIDFVGGVSMGAVIGAGVAMGWGLAELDERIRKAFFESSPVDDITWPLIAMTRGVKVRERLAEHFGDRAICDLWLPFFCCSSNLTTGEYQVHRQGLVREALRASLSLPGVLPPVTVGENVLVDGALLNNFPADVMRSVHSGPIVGVDVGRGRSIEARDVRAGRSLIPWLLSGRWRNGPPIVSLLMRSATLTADREVQEAHQLVDVLVLPDIDEIEIRDWKAYEPAVAEGRRAALSALAKLDGPVTGLRRLAGR